jgi:hypothetical protein
MRRRRQREIIIVVFSLLVGLALGMVVGNFLLTPNYYLVTVDNAGQWLSSRHPDEAQTVAQAVTQVDTIRTASSFARAARDANTDIQTLVSGAYQTLGGTEGNSINVCLGVDNRPDQPDTPTMQMVLTADFLHRNQLPNDSQKIDGPRPSQNYWVLLSCQPPPHSKGR